MSHKRGQLSRFFNPSETCGHCNRLEGRTSFRRWQLCTSCHKNVCSLCQKNNNPCQIEFPHRTEPVNDGWDLVHYPTPESTAKTSPPTSHSPVQDPMVTFALSKGMPRRPDHFYDMGKVNEIWNYYNYLRKYMRFDGFLDVLERNILPFLNSQEFKNFNSAFRDFQDFPNEKFVHRIQHINTDFYPDED